MVRDESWWQCGSPDNYHDLNMFDVDKEVCTNCGMGLEEYWMGYEAAINDVEGRLGGGAYRIRRATSRSRPLAAMYVEEGEDECSTQRPERAYIQLGMGE